MLIFYATDQRHCFQVGFLTSQGCLQGPQRFAGSLAGCSPSAHWSPPPCKPPALLPSLFCAQAFCPSCSFAPSACSASSWLPDFPPPHFPSLVVQLLMDSNLYTLNHIFDNLKGVSSFHQSLRSGYVMVGFMLCGSRNSFFYVVHAHAVSVKTKEGVFELCPSYYC